MPHLCPAEAEEHGGEAELQQQGQAYVQLEQACFKHVARPELGMLGLEDLQRLLHRCGPVLSVCGAARI